MCAKKEKKVRKSILTLRICIFAFLHLSYSFVLSHCKNEVSPRLLAALKRYLSQRGKPYTTSRPPRPRPSRRPFKWRPRPVAVDIPPLESLMHIDEPHELEVVRPQARGYPCCYGEAMEVCLPFPFPKGTRCTSPSTQGMELCPLSPVPFSSAPPPAAAANLLKAHMLSMSKRHPARKVLVPTRRFARRVAADTESVLLHGKVRSRWLLPSSNWLFRLRLLLPSLRVLLLFLRLCLRPAIFQKAQFLGKSPCPLDDSHCVLLNFLVLLLLVPFSVRLPLLPSLSLEFALGLLRLLLVAFVVAGLP